MSPKYSKRLLSACMFSAMLLTPLSAGGQSPECGLSTEDTVAGLGTQITVTNCRNETIMILPPFGTTYKHPIGEIAQGKSTIMIPANETRIAGQYVVTVGTKKAMFNVLPDKPYRAKLTASATRIQTTQDGTTITATLMDQFDNPISGNPLVLLSNRSKDSIDALARQTDAEGMQSWKVRSSEQGQMTLTVFDILHNLRLDTITVNVGSALPAMAGDLIAPSMGGEFGTIDHFSVKIQKDVATVKVNEVFSLNITALDKNENIVQSYQKSVIVTSSDPDGDLPKKGFDAQNPAQGQLDFRPSDQGVRSVPLSSSFRHPGTQTITVQEKGNPSIKGVLSVQVVGDGPGGGAAIQILSPANGSSVNTTSVLLQGKAPSLTNLIVIGGANLTGGDTDAEGVFRIQVALDPALVDQTLFVQSENKQYQSLPVHFKLDRTAPAIQSITLDPATGKSSETAKIIVVSEPGLQEVSAIVDTKTVKLAEEEAKRGTYTGSFVAPDIGEYDIKIMATDTAKNTAEMLTKWTVKAKGVAKIEGVQATSKPQAVQLDWQAVTQKENLRAYNIYVSTADQPTNYLYKLQAGQNATSALIKGLDVGTQYFFTMTGVNEDGEESMDKSTPVSATPLGMKISVQSQAGRLLLTIKQPPDLTLSGYRVEMGTEPDTYVSSLKFEPAQSIIIPDLLDNIEYMLRITPISLTGKELSDLATMVSGTPNGEGFHAAAADPIPTTEMNSDIPTYQDARITSSHLPDVPAIPSTGISTYATIILLILMTVGGFLAWKKRNEKQAARNFIRMMNTRYNESP